MRTLVVFDSNYGNTKAIAETIAEQLGHGVAAVAVSGLNHESLAGVELLVVGSPIIGWKPSERMQQFLAGLVDGSLRGVEAAAFDTRVKLFIHGDAAGKISRALEKAGARIVARPRGFIVEGKEGPLAAGEVEKAAEWARGISAAIRR